MGRGTSAVIALRRAAAGLGIPLAMLAVAALAAPSAAAPAPRDDAAPYDLRHFICPVGGERFDQDVGYSAFPLITLPDGSWLGDSAIDAQIPSCPDNGLVILPDYEAMAREGGDRMAYHSYTPAELARLPELIADPAYISLEADGRHAQAYWLATQLGRPALDRFRLLQRATWAATAPPLRRRLVERLAAEGPALIDAADPAAPEKRFLLYYIVNALRELGRFDEALALLEKAEAGGPPVLGPENPDDLHGPGDYAPRMRLAIAQKDDGRFPVELLGRRLVTDICDGKPPPPYDQRTPATAAACRARREREARETAESEAAIAESLELEQNPGALKARCAATPEARRGKGLAMACESLQQERDEMAAAQLAEDGPALAAACEATPEVDRKGPLFYGCISYSTALESALADAVAGDDEAWAILCPGGGEHELGDRDRHVSSACGLAGKLREDREIEALLADPAKIDAQCGDAPRDELPPILFAACLERYIRRRDARMEQLASDEAVFARDCRRFGGKLAQSRGSSGDDDEQICRNAYNLRENRKARAAAEAKGLVCWPDVAYSPDRPECVPRAEYDAERPRVDERFDENGSLGGAARARAAEIVAKARADGTYPKRRRDDRW